MINYSKYLLFVMLVLISSSAVPMCDPCALNIVIGSPFNGGQTFAAAFSPTSNCFAAGDNANNLIYMFTVDPATCQLTPAGAPVSSGGAGTQSIAFSPDGLCLAVSNINSNQVSTFSVNPLTCQITLIGTVSSGGLQPNQLAFSPNGDCLAIVNSGSDNLVIFNVTNCALSSPDTFAFAAGSSPASVGFSPTACSNGQYFLLVSLVNAGVNNLARFNIDPATCGITHLTDVPSGGSAPQRFSFSSTGCLAVPNLISNNVALFTVNADCTLTGPTLFATGTNPRSAAFSNAGDCLAVTNASQISVFGVNAGCTLQVPAVNYPAGLFPIFATFSTGDCLAVIDGVGLTNRILMFTSAVTPPTIASTTVSCAGEVTVTGLANPGNTITVLNGITQIGGPVIAAADGSYSVTTIPLANGVYALTVQSANPVDPDCIATTPLPIVISVLEVPTLTADPTAICPGQSSTLTALVTGGTPPYTYAFSDGFVTVTAATLVMHVVAPAITTNFTVTATDGLGCVQVSAPALVTVNPGPSVVIDPPIDIVRFGETITLTALPSGGTPPYTFSWSGPNGFVAVTQEINIPNAIGVNAGTYTVTITDSNGCMAAAQAVVIITPMLSFPSCSVVRTSQPVISGSNDPFTLVTILINGTPIGTTLADALGNFSFIPAPLANGSYILQASVDIAGVIVVSDPIRLLIDTRTNLSPLSQAISNKYCFFC